MLAPEGRLTFAGPIYPQGHVISRCEPVPSSLEECVHSVFGLARGDNRPETPPVPMPIAVPVALPALGSRGIPMSGFPPRMIKTERSAACSKQSSRDGRQGGQQ